MNSANNGAQYTPKTIAKDLLAGTIVFLVALPLCLGIALASGASAMSGLIAGIVGGIVIGFFSGSHTSVSGPAAGLTAIVAAQIAAFKTPENTQEEAFQGFLLAVVIAGALQVVMGLFKAGALSAFFPMSVIKGLLAAIGVILLLKQLPVLFGHWKDMESLPFVHAASPGKLDDGLVHEMHGTAETAHSAEHVHQIGEIFTHFYSSMWETFHYAEGFQWGAIIIGVFSLLFLIGWDRVKFLKNSLVPAPLIVVLAGVVLGIVLRPLGGGWALHDTQLVNVPVPERIQDFAAAIVFPDFSHLTNSTVYIAAITIAVVASLETLLNLEAVDKIDKKQRQSPPNRELFAQGIGNMTAGLFGGIPVTSVIIRGSVNVNAGSETKLSAIFHGMLLLICVLLMPQYLNMIPLSCLAAILLLTGYKLAHPSLFKKMWNEGRYQFMPFILTLLAIVMTDLLIGVSLGLVLSLLFILHANLASPLRKITEKHIEGDVLHIELPNEVTFLKRAALETALREAPAGSRVLLDARRTNYADPDILSLIKEFRTVVAPVRGVQLDVLGLEHQLKGYMTETVDFTRQEVRENLTPAQVIDILREGNKRYVEGHPLDRDLRQTLAMHSKKQQAFVALFSGIDSRTPGEILFDLDIGDAFTIRTPGNVIGERPLGGMEFAAIFGGVKVIVVLGHTNSLIIELAINRTISGDPVATAAGCVHLEPVLDQISAVIDAQEARRFSSLDQVEREGYKRKLSRLNVLRMTREIVAQSSTIRRLTEEGKLAVVGGLLDVDSGAIELMTSEAIGLNT
jgi:carbonic anhydrase